MKTRSLFVLAVLAAAGCSHVSYTIPEGAPMQLTEPTPIHHPNIRIDGKWVKSDQDGMAFPGETVLNIPATQPAKP